MAQAIVKYSWDLSKGWLWEEKDIQGKLVCKQDGGKAGNVDKADTVRETAAAVQSPQKSRNANPHFTHLNHPGLERSL